MIGAKHILSNKSRRRRVTMYLSVRRMNYVCHLLPPVACPISFSLSSAQNVAGLSRQVKAYLTSLRILVPLKQLAQLLLELLLRHRDQLVVFVGRYDDHIASHIVMKTSAQLRARYLIFSNLVVIHGEVDLNGHARNRVLLKPQRRHEEAVNDILRPQSKLDHAPGRNNKRRQLRVVAACGIGRIDPDEIE